MSMLRDYLEHTAKFRRTLGHVSDGLKYICPEEAVLVRGMQPIAKLPSPVHFALGHCFANASRMVCADATLSYTEGYYLSYMPILHAWVTLPDGTIYDPTLDGPEDGNAEHYLGIPFATSWYLRHLGATGRRACVMLDECEMFNRLILQGDFEVACVQGVST